MDEILVKEHDERLLKVLEKLRESGMALNKKKCQFRVEELIFLGHKTSGAGISADSEKGKALSEMQTLLNHKELKSEKIGKHTTVKRILQ